MTRYVLWDWNGTLLDDTAASIGALNEMLARRHYPPISTAFYRAKFAFPVKPFYESIGLDLSQEDWDALAREYHACYLAQPMALNAEARAAVERVRAAGCGQSIISALRQDLLEAATRHYGIADYMERIVGSDNLNGASKVDRARELLRSLARRGRSFVLIGDSLHDYEVAQALGIDCVLCAQGSHAIERLRPVAPTGETLLSAVSLALAKPVNARVCR